MATKPSPRGLIGLAGLLVLAAGVSLHVLQDESSPVESPPGVPAPSTAPRPPEPTAASKERPGPGPARETSPPQTNSSTFAHAQQESTNYLQLARSLHGAAASGDPDAQYQLYWTLDYCHRFYRLYFGSPPRRRTLDEGLRWATVNAHSLDAEEGRRVHQRCHELEEFHASDFGDRDSWLAKAAEARQPNAQLVMATKVFQDAAAKAAPEADIGHAAGRALVAEALSSRDPEVIFQVASMLHWRSGGESFAEGEPEAWLLVACQRGLDCSPGAERTRMACRFVPNCQPYETLADMLRRHATDAGAVDARAAEINRLIDAGDWTALGFGPSAPGQ